LHSSRCEIMVGAGGKRCRLRRINTYTWYTRVYTALWCIASRVTSRPPRRLRWIDEWTEQIRDFFGRAHRVRYATGENVRKSPFSGCSRTFSGEMGETTRALARSARPPPKRAPNPRRGSLMGKRGDFVGIHSRAAPHRRAAPVAPVRSLPSPSIDGTRECS